MPWVKGQSGNPSGRRPVGESIGEKLRHGIEKHRIVDKVIELASKPGPQQMTAIKLCLEYGIGKPVQQTVGAHVQEIRVSYVDKLNPLLSVHDLPALPPASEHHDEKN